MKRIFISSIIVLCMAVVGCKSEEQKKEEQAQAVKEWAEDFARFASANMTDSLIAAYPGMTASDSVRLDYQPDAISVTPEAADSTFLVHLASGVTLNVNLNPDGKISVTDSHGLFHFNQQKMEIAQKTGMYDESLSDLALAKRFNDESFFQYVTNLSNKSIKPIVSLGQSIPDPPSGGSMATGNDVIVNNTDVTLNGSEYSIVYKIWGYYEEHGKKPVNGEEFGEWTEVRKGKPIPPKGSIKIPYMKHTHFGETVNGVKVNISPEEIKKRFFPYTYTGTEYQDYLNSKK